MRRTLFAEHLIYSPHSPGEPYGIKLPTTCLGLFNLAGYSRSRTHTPDLGAFGKLAHGATPGHMRWREFVRIHPTLRRWLRDPHAFVPPPHWPDAISAILPPHILPRDWALGVLPCNREQMRNSPFYAMASLRGMRALSAYAHGWPTLEAEIPHMALAAQEVQSLPQFVMWAYNPHLTVVPLPSGNASFFERARCRLQVAKDPLGVGSFYLNKALPAWALEPGALRDLPRAPFDPRRSSKKPTLADLSVVDRQVRWQV